MGERCFLRLVIRPDLLLAVERSAQHLGADVAGTALVHDLVSEPVAWSVLGPRQHPRALFELRVLRFETAKRAVLDGWFFSAREETLKRRRLGGLACDQKTERHESRNGARHGEAGGEPDKDVS